MTRADFVREMQKSLADQKRKADQDQREKLHDADVINNQGLKKWDELFQEAKSLSQEVGITFWRLEGHSFRLTHGDSELDVRLDGSIKYSGKAEGEFRPVVQGSELMYSLRDKFTPKGSKITGSLERIGELFTIEGIAEHLVRVVVEKT